MLSYSHPQAAGLVEEITPLLRELRNRGVVDNLDVLTKSVAEATSHLEELQRAVLDEKNVSALRDSVKTLTDTLKSIEVLAPFFFLVFRLHVSFKSVSFSLKFRLLENPR